MTFFRFIEKLQKKSRQKRKFIALAVTSVCFSFIFLIWLSTFQLSMEPVGTEKTHATLSPISSVKRIASHFIDDLTGILEKTKNFSLENSENIDPSINKASLSNIKPSKSTKQFLDENLDAIPNATTTMNIETTSKNTSFYKNAGL
ncbi:hypothetical protein KJ973_02450 [Patescibacteria group bacterium]|nr:hypothetical protein [Patescibacteria group bacterium]MBU1519524.1 hypothetical protein [Patescibacteria group bacterium]MBU2416740.1 hypothetical protein [Patescibacteria group bacterium]MBU2460984.1 hypothetical protein [Patescibacteria group bacterium]